MRHATEHDLDELEELLVALRGIPGLRERKRGSFSVGSRALLHFHADDDGFYADVRLDQDFERVRVTTAGEQAQLVSRVRTTARARGGSGSRSA